MIAYKSAYQLGERISAMINSRDYTNIREVLEDNVVWNIPNPHQNPALKDTTTIEQLLHRIDVLSSIGLNLFVNYVCVNSAAEVVLMMHNWGINGAYRIDEHLVAALEIKNGKVARVTSYLSDIDALPKYVDNVKQ